VATAKTAAGSGKNNPEYLVCPFSNQRFFRTNTDYIEISLGGKATSPALKNGLFNLLKGVDKKIIALLVQYPNFKNLHRGGTFNLKTFLQKAETEKSISAALIQAYLEKVNKCFTLAIVCPILNNPDSSVISKPALKKILKGYGINLQDVVKHIIAMVRAKLEKARSTLRDWLIKINQAWELGMDISS